MKFFFPFLFPTYEARIHQVDVCPHVRYAILRVPFKKYYFLARTRLNMARTRSRHGSNMHRTQLNTARIRLEQNQVLFSNYLVDQKRIQWPKNPSLFKNFIWGVNRNSTSYFLEGVYEVYMIYILRILHFFGGV